MMDKFIDLYLKHPIWVDGIAVCVLIFGNHYLPSIYTIKYDIASQTEVLSSIIGTCVSLTGFVLAALTIVVAFKSNIASKPGTQASNALELLFSTENYSKVVKVFKDAIIELTIVFVGLYALWLILPNLSSAVLFKSNVNGALLAFLTIIRTLFVLFLVLRLDSADENTGDQ